MDGSTPALKKYLKILWSLFGAGVVMVIILFTLIVNGNLGFMPSLTELENIETSLASEVYSCDSVVIRKFFYKENRTYVPYEQISPNVIKALIATEDERFYSHSGIDIRGLLRVAKGVIVSDESSGGGSTISQQLAKMLFPREDMEHKITLAFRKFRDTVESHSAKKIYPEPIRMPARRMTGEDHDHERGDGAFRRAAQHFLRE